MGDAYCSVCLVTDLRMFEMSPTLVKIYEELIAVQDSSNIKQVHACYECAYLLHKYAEFKTKCCKAYSILQSFIDGSSEVTIVEKLKNIDRKQNKLESKLSMACITTKYYLPVKKNEYHAPEKKFKIGKVKTESIVSPVEQDDEDDFNIRENLQPTNSETSSIDGLNNDDQHEFGNEMLKIEFLDNNTNQHEIENHFQSVNMLEADCSDYISLKDNTYNTEDVKLELEVESTQEQDIPNDVLSVDKLGPQVDGNSEESNAISDDQFDSDSDELNEILARYPIPNSSNEANSKRKKRKLEDQNDASSVRNNVLKKRKTRLKKEKVENIKVISVNDINKKQLRKKVPQRSKTKSVMVLNRDKIDRRYSFDPSIFKDYATIVLLTPEDARREVLLRKESTNYKQCTYKCELCYRGFITQSTYQTHMNKHSLEYGSNECEICQLRFSDKKNLRKHRLVCHTRKFLCKICPYICYSPDQAKNHMCSHKGKKYPCNECGEVFKFPNSLLTHTRLKHSVELVCELCGSTFGSKKGLQVHRHKLHKRETNEYQGPKCEECDVHFSSELAWRRHLVLCSKHDVTDGCGVCGDIFPDAASLRAHAKTHGPRSSSICYQQSKKHNMKLQLPTNCKYCELELTNNKEYKSHMTTEHPQSDIAQTLMKIQQKKCVCEICGMMFKQPCFLQLHQRKHTGEKPYSCPECGKKFTSLNAVKAHQPVHTNIYPYKCHICDRAFGDKGRLNKHVKYHLGIRPHKCWGCERTFLFKCEMKNHAQYVHGKVPWPKRDRTKRGLDDKE